MQILHKSCGGSDEVNHSSCSCYTWIFNGLETASGGGSCLCGIRGVMKRIECDRDYLIIAPNDKDSGYYQSLSERHFLLHNLVNFMKQYPDVKKEDITIYELNEINY